MLSVQLIYLFYVIHINVCTSGSRRSLVWIFKDLTAMQNTSSRSACTRRLEEGWQRDSVLREIFYLSVARSPRAIVSPSSASCSSFLLWSLCFSSSCSSVIPCALVTFHENVYSLCVRNSDVFGLFSVFLSPVLVSDVIRTRVICNFLGTPMCRLLHLFNYLLDSEDIRKSEDKYWVEE